MNYNTILQWYLTSGITETISETPVDRFRRFAETTATAMKKIMPGTSSSDKMNTDSTINMDTFVSQARRAAFQALTIETLKESLVNFEGCSLKKTAVHTFLGVGQTQNPTVFCIFDAPRAPADKSGDLFSGDLGLRMQKMLSAIELSVQTNTYIAPLIPWRLPGDRKPTEREIQICLPFLQKQIELIQPHFLLLFGALAAKTLLGIESISKARQEIHSYTFLNKKIPVIATFGPEMVSQSKLSRVNAWADLQKLQKLIQENS